ncbi:hypothetical protein KCU87_g510, partial [Aureobasidium melanogenum]
MQASRICFVSLPDVLNHYRKTEGSYERCSHDNEEVSESEQVIQSDSSSDSSPGSSSDSSSDATNVNLPSSATRNVL